MTIADSYGATALPIVATWPQPVGDPLLFYVGSFLRAIANAYGLAAWQSVAPKTMPVKTIFTHDPHIEYFREDDLPALFLWREGSSERVQIAQDIRFSKGTVAVLWVFPPAKQAIQRVREPYPKALFDLLDDAFEIGRDPAWQLAGDAYPTGAQVTSYGSCLAHYAGFRRMHFNKWQPATLDIAISDGGEKKSYRAAMGQMYVEEQLAIGDRGFPMGSLDAKMMTTDQGFGDGGVLVVEGTVPAPTND